MTDLLNRPVLRVPVRDAGPSRSAVISAVVASLWVAAVGLVGCVLLTVAAWFAADTGSFAGAVRVGGVAWLVAGGAGLHLDGYSVTVVPLGFVLVAGLLLHRGGRWVAERGEIRAVRPALVATVVMSLSYAAALELAAVLVRSDDAQVGLMRAAAAGLLLAAVAGGSGVLRGSELWGALLARLPEEARASLAGGAAGMLLMIAAGGALLTASLVMHFSEAVTLAEGLGAGSVGGLAVAAIGISLVPNGVLCAGAFMAGPGFHVGQGTLVAPGAVDLGPLPAFPLLAALPRHADHWWVDLLVLAPVFGGVAAGVLAVRAYPVFSIDRAALRGALAGLAGGVGFGLVSALATGAVGPGRMQQIGPDVWAVLLVCALAGLVGGAISGLSVRWLGWMRQGRDAG